MQNQIVLVDGVLECGRHIVAERVAKSLRADLFVGNATTQAYEYVRAMRSALDGIHSVVIECSWRMSEIRRKLNLPAAVSPVYSRMLTRLALTRDAHAIICLSDLRTYMTMVSKTYKTHHIEGLINAALVHEAWCNMKPVIRTYMLHHPQDECLNDALDWSYSKHGDGPGAGHWEYGNILIVGDRNGKSEQPYELELNAPFVSMSGVGCSEWLAHHLDEHKISENHLYWVNSRDKFGELTDAEFEARLEPLHTIALGRNAAEWCIANHIQAEVLEHPQYHMCFMAHEPYNLGPVLRKFIDLREM